jgi:NAD(P)-dependent dehydrogenase (short-subunit alcohol dehydrogenase family)
MRVLITGAARAIGKATAEELTRRGHDVVATARDVTALADVAAAERLPLDVTDATSITAALDAAGDIDALVNNAALTASGPLEEFPIEETQRILETNVLGPMRMVQALAPAWRARRSGVIVNVSSVQGRVSTPLAGAYAASKFALEALSETLHYELGHFQIRTVIIEPGYIAPGMKDSPQYRRLDEYAELWTQWEGNDDRLTGPAGRPGPELVATAIADAIEDPATPLRVPVGADADLVLATRKELTDEAFEEAMRATLQLDW